MNRKIILTFVNLLIAITLTAQFIPDPMKPARLVNDFSGLLSEQERGQLEQKLVAYNDTTSTQIAVVIVDTLNGYDVSQYAFELGEKWGVGGSKFNNGVVFLIKNKTHSSKGEVFIATGYGMEAHMPDILVNRIVDQVVIPRFKEGKYNEGIDKGVEAIILLSQGKYTGGSLKSGAQKNMSIAIIIFIVFIIFFSVISGIRRSRSQYSPGHALPWWMLMTMGGMAGKQSGSFGNFSSGSGSFGGGGGFSGFGGGSFGGGGAGGSW